VRYGTVAEGPDRIPVAVDERGVTAIADLVPGFTGDLMDVIAAGLRPEIERAAATASAALFRPEAEVVPVAPYLHPRKLWGIGLNYVDHAADLSEQAPDEPASFIKGDHTVIGPGEPIQIPSQSGRTTAEAEVGLVIGRECRDVDEVEALDYVFGLVPILDQTAEDILQRNPRFLTRSKNFPGFFSFGPWIVPLDEVSAGPDLGSLRVETVLNGAVHRANTVDRMMHAPRRLVSFHSRVMPFFPGDIISTGTPGAAVIAPGDVAECRIEGFAPLRNPVVAGGAR
jgi:2-keto-4-pentenoate hydratase/2-oxohepta-3-ene-1,7-dioic acid hydratase in catechol pathway